MFIVLAIALFSIMFFSFCMFWKAALRSAKVLVSVSFLDLEVLVFTEVLVVFVFKFAGVLLVVLLGLALLGESLNEFWA